MSVAFKKIFRKNPTDKNMPGKYYPQLVVTGRSADLNDIAYKMKEKSSLTLGDIRSVLTNFVESMRESLFTGQSLNIENFGVFSLSAKTEGVLKREECTGNKIKSVRICFRSSSNVRPDVNSTRAGDRIDFYDIESLVQGNSNGTTGGGGSDNEEEVVDPSV